MAWRVHHVAMPARLVRETATFYTTVLGMDEKTPEIKPVDHGIFETDDQQVAWFNDGNAMVHLSQPTRQFCVDNKLHINPLIRGHVAFEVDDLNLVKDRLRERDVYYADPGNWALDGAEQIYFLDPAGNAVEVNWRIDGRGFGSVHEDIAPADWHLHHVTLPARLVAEAAEFYTAIFGMEQQAPPYLPSFDPGREFHKTDQAVAWFDDGRVQFHLAMPINNLNASRGFFVDPGRFGHAAIQVDDLDGVVARLRETNVPFDDPGQWAMKDFRQIYVHDPAMNTLEINATVA